jgi:NTP pyrophosphatase (non-canonical NTP hydrolase)
MSKDASTTYEALAGRTMSPPDQPLQRIKEHPHLMRFLFQLREDAKTVEILSDNLKREIFYGQDKGLLGMKPRVSLTQYRVSHLVEGLSKDHVNFLHAAIGVLSEAGEYFDRFMKVILNGEPMDRANVIEETGDHLWYLTIPARMMGFNLEECQDKNISKLALRYGDKFSDVRAVNRDLTAELQVLQKDPTADEATKLKALAFLDSIICSENRIEFFEEDGGLIMVFHETGGDTHHAVGANITEALVEMEKHADPVLKREPSRPREDRMKELQTKLDEANAQLDSVDKMVARMHAAAVGEVTGPKRGVVEDIEDMRAELVQLRKEKADADTLVNEQVSNHQRRRDAKQERTDGL